MTTNTHTYCSEDELCSQSKSHFGKHNSNDRARAALDTRRKMYRQQHDAAEQKFLDLSVELLKALGMLGDLQEKAGALVEIVQSIGILHPTVVTPSDRDKLAAARTLLEAQKEAM